MAETEEYQLDERLLENLFEHYNTHFTGAVEAIDEGVEKVKQRLAGLQHRSVCLICLEVVAPTHHTWHCKGGCYQTFHLVCIKEWARKNKSDVVARGESRLNPERFPAAAREVRENARWRCPLCQSGYSQIPSAYVCYCGKEVDPPFDGWKPPHSCGELCENELPCGHTCVVRCHPGPCPPCPRTVSCTCYCGSLRSSKRCGYHMFSCGGVCGNKLPCGHSCKATCHEGECPSCIVSTAISCRCGKSKLTGPCGNDRFDCGQACGRPLSCGVHSCPVVCHEGDCKPCGLGRTTCPCGKVKYSDLKCDSTAPSCGDTCGKLLPCGRHSCMERCHEGPCPSACREVVTKTCRCGRTTKKAQCGVDVKCEIRCDRMRSCGRHPCKRRCCDGSCPPCEEVCKRRLNCGNHRCRDSCHSGSCQLCPLKNTVSCACGRMQYTLPCGAEKRAVEGRCYQSCPVQWVCRHRGREETHRCHYGACPPCSHPCGTPLPCGHSCTHLCHDPQGPQIPPFQQPPPPQPFLGNRTNPGNVVPQALQVLTACDQMWAAYNGHAPTPCPPCTAPVPVTCLGAHMTVTQPCHSAAPFSCDQPCGQLLSCGNHYCSKPCHVTAAARSSNSAASETCESCDRACEVPQACGHACALSCHQPPCPRCAVKVRRICFCGKSSLEFECAEIRQAEENGSAASLLRCVKPCHRPLSGCPHFCKLECHPGDCNAVQCTEETTVRCKCRRIKKKMKCADVKVLLHQMTGRVSYDATTQLKLIECDAQCKQKTKAEAPLVVERQAGAAHGGGSEGGAEQHGTSSREDNASGLRHRKTRQERQKEKEQQAREKEAKRRRKQIARFVVVCSLVFVMVGLIVSVGLYCLNLLTALDEKAQEAWKVEGK